MPYARAGETREARYLRIINVDTGEEYKKVREVNSDEGWLTRFKVDAAGRIVRSADGERAEVERLTGLNLRIDIDEARWGSRNIPEDSRREERWVEWKPLVTT